MADFNEPPKRRDTLETYSSLVGTEVRSLSQHLMTIAEKVAHFTLTKLDMAALVCDSCGQAVKLSA